MPIGNKMFLLVSRKLLEIHRNECCEELSSREWEQIQEKSVAKPEVRSGTGSSLAVEKHKALVGAMSIWP